jgi:hypothetical protein
MKKINVSINIFKEWNRIIDIIIGNSQPDIWNWSLIIITQQKTW